MHVEEEFTTTILSNNGSLCGRKRVDEMPMPVMQVDANVLTPVGYAMFFFKISCGVVSWDDDGCALKQVIFRWLTIYVIILAFIRLRS